MAKNNDAAQKSIDVPMHKRIAMGEKLNGQSLKAGGSSQKGGLSGAKKK
jgi:hypothetical protein